MLKGEQRYVQVLVGGKAGNLEFSIKTKSVPLESVGKGIFLLSV